MTTGLEVEPARPDAGYRPSERFVDRQLRGLVERCGPPRAAIWAALATAALSIAVSLTVYEIIDIDYLGNPIALVMPVVLPFALALPSYWVIATLVRAMIRREAENERQRAELVRLAEEAAAQKLAAERASAAKSDFLASLSHELRTPLNAVIGFSDVMANETLGPLGSQRYLDYAADINASGRHLLDLVNDLLDLARIERGGLSIEPEWLQPAELVHECASLFRTQAERSRLTIAVTCDGGHHEVRADRRALKQMLLNLMSNAVKFTPPGGRIEIACEGGAEARLWVRDSGIGIQQADHDRVFQPFVQVDNVLTRRHAGTGLGLSLVRALVELHDGRVELASSPGTGTTVALYLPDVRRAVVAAQ